MSETLSQDPENLGSGYNLASSYPPTPATPSSTVQDVTGSNLPPFSTFSSDIEGAGFGSDRLFTDSRLLDISSWDYYGETRLLDRSENGLSVIASQPQYRPWESKPIDSTSQESLRHSFASATPISTFADAFSQNGVPKLPSFQSQFQTFNEPAPVTSGGEPTLTTLTNLTPVSPNSSSPGGHLTTLNSSFHTLSAVNARNYPLVPAPIQAREIPSIQQQFLDERHIQLYTHPTTSLTTLSNTIHSATIFPAQNGALLQNNQIITTPTVVTVLKTEPDLKLGPSLASLQDSDLKIQNVSLHHSQFQNPMSTVLDNNGIYNGLDKKLNGISAAMDSPTRNDFRKKERRKMRASSLESSAESDGASSMDVGSESSGQVASVSSTASFKSHHVLPANSGMEADEISGGNADKQVKKKRKRCGECIGCQRKDNCGDCAPCRNDKSHQICKQRRCEKLTEKKLYGDDGYIRGDSRRGRGKGRGAGSYRGRKPSGPVSLPTSATLPEPSGPSSRPSPQPVHIIKQEPAQQQTMAPMPFYADPNRFSTPVWQADPTQGWAQGQFIQQIPAATQPGLEGYTPQQYSNGIYQTAYQQAPGFETNTFYTTGAVQVLSRPPSASNQTQLTSRPNGSYAHTSSPVTAQAQSNQRTNISAQYQQEYSGNNQNYVAPATTPTGNVDSSQSGGLSRPDSVNSANSVPSNNPNFQAQHTGNFTPISSSNFSPVSNTSSSFASSNMSGNSGNAMPGYPPVSSHPQLASHSYSGGYPGDELSGQSNPIESPAAKGGGWSGTWDQSLSEQSCNNTSAKQECDEAAVQQYVSSQQNHTKSEESSYTHQQNGNNHDKIVQSEMQETDKSQSDRINLNSRIKTMILNKQQQQLESKESQKVENNKTGHFLSFSHHHRPFKLDDGGGAPSYQSPFAANKQVNHTKEAIQQTHPGYQDAKWGLNNQRPADHTNSYATYQKLHKEDVGGRENGFAELPKYKFTKASPVSSDNSPPDSEKVKGTVGLEIPPCSCLPYQALPEPGSYYTHLGCANSLATLRQDLETRTGVNGKALRIEKVCYTGKEGKTPQGCPIAKWIIRRTNYEEKYLIIVKQRPGHFCDSAIIVVCIVAWEGVMQGDADAIYAMLCEKLNKYGLPTNRRCGTNEPRTCACQGLDPETCGASFSFGCSWSMYYNGCKFARSKTVRKFRLSVKDEEDEVKTRLQRLATHLSPLYKELAPQSFKNQCQHEDIASDCRLGLEAGRPFSGVTACLDFCAHAHKDTHNMNNGCTVVVTLTKHRGISRPSEEQLHVLPLYVIDSTDEFGSRKDQQEKIVNGSIEVLYRYECEVRVRNIPQEACRRSGKKRKEEGAGRAKAAAKKEHTLPVSCSSPNLKTPGKQLQSNHVSSTSGRQSFDMFSRYDQASELYYIPERSTVVEKHPVRKLSFENIDEISNRVYKDVDAVLQRKQTDTALNMTYPYLSRTNNNPHVYENNLHLPNTNLDSYNVRSAAIQINEHFPYNRVSNSLSESNQAKYQNNEIKSNMNGVWPTKPKESILCNGNFVPQLNSHDQSPKNNLPPFSFFKSSKKFNAPFPQSPDSVFVQNPFDDSVNPYHQNYYDCDNDSELYSYPPNWFLENKPAWPDPVGWSPPKSALGEVTEVIDNTHCFNDNQIGGVAIALSHGSVLFECAKHELHATTALKNPNRKSPTRISLVFYQHRNLNKAKHGWDEHEEKMRLRKLDSKNLDFLKLDSVGLFKNLDDGRVLNQNVPKLMMMRVPTMTTISLTTVFPMYPCVVTGPYRGVTSAQQVY